MMPMTAEGIESWRKFLKVREFALQCEQIDALCDLALRGLEVKDGGSTINWYTDGVIPPVAHGNMGYFLVAVIDGKACFGAHYLNKYPLNYEDGCPSATKENGWTPCKDCENGEGHPETGWFNESGEDDRQMYEPLWKHPIAWAMPPVFNLVSNPLPAPPSEGGSDGTGKETNHGG
jgi:hypothetical protein